MSTKRIKDIDVLRMRGYGALMSRHRGHSLGYGRIDAPMLPGFALITQECKACDTLLGFLAVPRETADAMESSMRLPPSQAHMPGMGALSQGPRARVLNQSCRFSCTLCIDNNSCKTCPLCKRRLQ